MPELRDPESATPPRPNRPPRKAAVIEQSPLRGRRLSTIGWVTLTLGSGCLGVDSGNRAKYSTSAGEGAGYSTSGWQRVDYSMSTWDWVLLVAGVVLVVAGVWAVLRGRRHLTPVLTSLQDVPADEQTVLFLRAFTDDTGFSRVAALFTSMQPTPADLRTEEDQVARAFAPFGRMVALGSTSDRLPRLGAERHYASDQTWKAEVLAALDRAALVLLVAGAGRNLGWEVNEVVGRDDPTRLVLLVSRNRRQYAEFREAFGERFPNGLPDYPPARMRHLLLRGRFVRAAIWFDSDWTPHWEMLDGRFPMIGLPRRTQRALPRALRKVYQRAGVPARITSTTPRPWAVKLSVPMIVMFWLTPLVLLTLLFFGFYVLGRINLDSIVGSAIGSSSGSSGIDLGSFFSAIGSAIGPAIGSAIGPFLLDFPPTAWALWLFWGAVIAAYGYRLWCGGPYAIMTARIQGVFFPVYVLALVVSILPAAARWAFIAVGLLVLVVLGLPVAAMLLLRRDVRDWIDSRL